MIKISPCLKPIIAEKVPKSYSPSPTVLFVSLEFFVPFGKFSLIGDVTISVEGLQILTYAPHLWPLGSEGSLACHTYCGTGHPYNNGHLRGPVTLTPNDERFAVELSLPVLTT